jgi:hypothetical protein
MRYNNYKNDPLSKNNPTYAIASRKDLDETTPDCRGATDAKVASIRDIKGKANKKISIVSGPTSQTLQPFSTLNPTCSNVQPGKYLFKGLPEVYKFTWVDYNMVLFN